MNISQSYVTHGAVAVASLLLGGGVGFLVTKHVLEAKYEEIISKEIKTAKELYKRQYKIEEYASAVEASKILVSYSSCSETTTKEVPNDLEVTVEKIKQSIEENRNVFRNVKEIDIFDDQEIEDRTPEYPYIITEHEFQDNEHDHDQITLSYFEEDDVLADDNDAVIEDSDNVVGDDNLTRFGYGSGNNNVLFIRNEKLSTDFEIAKSNGSYAREVLGFIEHSEIQSRIHKFRGDDE